MELSNDNLFFKILNEKTKNVVYEYEMNLLNFQRELLSNEKISLYYALKDIAFSVDEKMQKKLKLNTGGESLCFVVMYGEKILFEISLDVTGLGENNLSQNEIELYFIFEKISKDITSIISEEHKKIVLSGNSEEI